MHRARDVSTATLSVLLLVLGVAMVATTLARGGGAATIGVVLGVVFAALGAARLWLSHHLRTR